MLPEAFTVEILARTLGVLLVPFGLTAAVQVAPCAAQSISIAEFPVTTGGAHPDIITAGPDGNLWFTMGFDPVASIGRITPSGSITEFPVPTHNSNPHGITSGPDGNVWFTEGDLEIGNKIGRITPAGEITEFPVPVGSGPRFITAGPDGNLWFTQYVSSIGRMTIDGTFAEFPIPTTQINNAETITLGSDGNLWFAEGINNRIARITPSGTVDEFMVPTTVPPLFPGGPTSSSPAGITAGPDGNLWFTEFFGNNIGKITPAGEITEFTIPTGAPGLGTTSGASSVAAGPDGNLWFTEFSGNKIGQITPAGIITEFDVPTAGSSPSGIATGPDGRVWFTEYYGNKIGRITLLGAPTPINTTGSPTPTPSPVQVLVGPGQQSGHAGEVVDFSFSMSGDTSASAYGFNILYDPNSAVFVPVLTEGTTDTVDCTVAADLASHIDALVYSFPDRGFIAVSFGDFSFPITSIGREGVIGTCKFMIKPGTSLAVVPLECDTSSGATTASDPNGNDIPAGCQNGTLTIQPQGTSATPTAETPTATIPPPPSVTATPANPPTAKATSNPDVVIEAGTAIAVPGQEVAVEVDLRTTGQPVQGFQADISFDPHTPILANAEGNPDCSLSSALQESNGIADWRFLPLGCLPGEDCAAMRAIVLQTNSLGASFFEGASTFACEIDVATTAETGNYPLHVSNTIYVNVSTPGEEFPAAAVDGNITVTLPPSPTATASSSPTETPSATVTSSASPTTSETPTITATYSPTETPGSTPSQMPTRSPTLSPTATVSPSWTGTPSPTSSRPPPPTPTLPPTQTGTATPSAPPSLTVTPTNTRTPTPELSSTRTPTPYPGDFGLPSNVLSIAAGPVTAGRFGPLPMAGHPPVLDVVVGGSDAPQVQVLHNDGQGNLTALPPLTLSLGAGSAHTSANVAPESGSQLGVAASGGIGALAAADLDGDGQLDLVVTHPATEQIIVLLGDGSEQFTEGPHVGLETTSDHLAVGELTGDGMADVVVADQSGVAVFGGSGGSNLMPLGHIDAGGAPADVVIADVTGDGTADLIIPVPSQNAVRVYAGDGEGGFGLISVLSVAAPHALLVGDLNGDRLPDLVVADAADPGLAIFAGLSGGGFSTSPTIIGGVDASALARADVNGDGRADLLALSSAPGQSPALEVLLGNGDGSFQRAPATPIAGAAELLVVDLNGDRLPDVAVSIPGANAVAVAINISPVTVVAGDANGDGMVTAEDVTQTAAEVFDGSDVLTAAAGEVASSDGVDANADGHVTAADLLGAMAALGAT